MKSSHLLRAIAVALTLAAAACSSSGAKDKPIPLDNPLKPDSRAAREQRLAADELYRDARQALDSNDFSTALSRYNAIATRFPFTEYATQADLERIYAQYRSYQADDALVSADRFLKEHPRHPAADYVQYLKGLINSTREEGLSGALGLDATKEDIGYLRRAFDDFSLLAQKYPTSRYTGDARQHMIDLRNRIARHEMHVVDYYMRRGAFLAAAKRAEQIVSQYPGAPATTDALAALEVSYRKAGLPEQAADAAKLLAVQRTLPPQQSDYPLPAKKPGWFGFGSSTPSSATPPPPAAQTGDAKPEKKSWLRQLFTPGSQEVEGPTLIIPTQPAPAAAPATDASGKAAAAPAAKDNEIRGDGFRIYMEPYDDDATAKAKADSATPAADQKAPAAPASPASPQAPDTAKPAATP